VQDNTNKTQHTPEISGSHGDEYEDVFFSSGMLRHAVWQTLADVSDKFTASIIALMNFIVTYSY
jgi:hypothetical protein